MFRQVVATYCPPGDTERCHPVKNGDLTLLWANRASTLSWRERAVALTDRRRTRMKTRLISELKTIGVCPLQWCSSSSPVRGRTYLRRLFRRPLNCLQSGAGPLTRTALNYSKSSESQCNTFRAYWRSSVSGTFMPIRLVSFSLPPASFSTNTCAESIPASPLITTRPFPT